MSSLLFLAPSAIGALGMLLAHRWGVREGRERARDDITDHRLMAGSMGSDEFVAGLECAAGIAERGPLPWKATS